MMDRIAGSLDFNAEALKLRAERQKTIASNIANADTPRYKAVDFNFAQALSAATGASSAGTSSASAVPLATSSSGHIAAPDGGSTLVHLQYRAVGQPSLDGNTVDTDVEQARFADNSVHYEASLRFLNGQIRTLLSAITGQS